MSAQNNLGGSSIKRLHHKMATAPVVGTVLRLCKRVVLSPWTIKRLFIRQREVLASLDQMENLRLQNQGLRDKLAIMQPLIDDYRHVCRRVADLEQRLVQSPATPADRLGASLQQMRNAA